MILREAKIVYSNKEINTNPDTINTPQGAARIIREYATNHDSSFDPELESLWVLSLDRKNKVKSIFCVHKGGRNQSLVDPVAVFKPLVLDSASCFIMAHNHPSGDCAPSMADIKTTKRINDASNLLSIPLHDHVIFDADSDKYYSFQEHGQL